MENEKLYLFMVFLFLPPTARSYSAHKCNHYYGSFISLVPPQPKYRRGSTVCVLFSLFIIWHPIYSVNQIEWKMTDIMPKPMPLHIVPFARCVHLHAGIRQKRNRIIISTESHCRNKNAKPKQIDLKNPKLNLFWNMVQLKLSKQMLHIHGKRGCRYRCIGIIKSE